MTDNKEDKFFYFPMISMPCTGSGYKKKRLSQNKLEMASIVSSQIGFIRIFLKREVYKLSFEDFIHSNCFFVTISFLRGYFCKIMCNGQQAELNFNLLKSTKMEPLEVFVVLEVSKYSFYILWSLTAIFQTFIRKQFFTFSFLDFSQTVIYLYNPFRATFMTPAS